MDDYGEICSPGSFNLSLSLKDIKTVLPYGTGIIIGMENFLVDSASTHLPLSYLSLSLSLSLFVPPRIITTVSDLRDGVSSFPHLQLVNDAFLEPR